MLVNRVDFDMRHHFASLVLATAVWHVANADVVRRTVDAIQSALGSARISHKEAAGMLEDMDKGQWHRMWQSGGNLAALMVIAARRPEFAHALREQLAALSSLGDRRLARLDQITGGDPKKCEGVLSEDFSWQDCSQRRPG